MRIALLAPLVTPIREPQVGGSQALVADLALELSRRGHEVDLFAASGSAVEGVSVVDTGVDPAVLPDALFRPGVTERTVPGGWRDAFATAFALVERGAYDVVHAHAFDAPAVDSAVELSAPVVHTVHLPPESSMLAALRRASTSVNPPTLVAVSASQAVSWRAAGVDVRMVANGVPVARIPWRRAAGGEVLFAGRLSPEKGASEAVEIAKSAGVPITVIGGAYDLGYAEALAGRWRGNPEVRFQPAVPRPEVWRRMSHALAVLCPVRWDEPYGLTAAEAQAAGTPVVGFRRGSLPEVVVHGRTGFLVEEGAIDEAARAIREIAAIDRAECRAHAERHLDLARTTSEYEQLYAAVRGASSVEALDR